MARGLNRLTALAIKAAQSAGWYGDGGGLYLDVDTKGGRRWMLRSWLVAVEGTSASAGFI